VQCEFCAIIKPVLDVFWVVVTQQLDSKLSNSFSTCLIDHKLSGKMHFHRKNICLKFGCKRSSMRTVTVFYAWGYWIQISTLLAGLQSQSC